MSEHYKFFQNKKCEYFPCHKVSNNDDFNCLFCYCPLYMLQDKCGGNFKYTNNVKDCSECTLPHGRSSHDFIMSKMNLVIAKGSEQSEK